MQKRIEILWWCEGHGRAQGGKTWMREFPYTPEGAAAVARLQRRIVERGRAYVIISRTS